MAKARAIVKRLKAIRNIRKITRTMELIATARFKKAMDRATEAAAYTNKISEIVADLARADLSFDHPLLKTHSPQKNGILLVLTSNRGLCGGYNGGVIKQASHRMAAASEAGQTLELQISGKRGISFFRFQKREISQQFTHFEDQPKFEDVEVLAAEYIDAYCKGEIDFLDIAYTKFISSSKQEAVLETILPLSGLNSEASPEEQSAKQDYEFLPSAEEILEEIVPAAFKARVLKCFLDAAVSEQIYRMVAMKGATENADEIVGNLSQQYNRARQAQITSELSEIIGGAAALE